MKKILFGFLTLLVFTTTHFSGFAWGSKGHTLVAEIAFTMIDTATRAKIKDCMEDMTLEQASTWMDVMRSNHKYDYMKPWHYVNIEKGETYQANKDPNIINELTIAIANLEHKETLSKEDAKKNLLVIFHLTGDLHMPLHVGYGVDKGGNGVQIKYLNKETNLHKVWDFEMIESEGITLNDCLLQLNGFDKTMVEKLKIINVENWAHQPRALLGNVYNFKDNTIDQAYVDRNKKIVEEQLLVAGIRLAAVLNHLFKA